MPIPNTAPPRKASTARRKPPVDAEPMKSAPEPEFTAPRPIRDTDLPSNDNVQASRYVEGKYVEQLEPVYMLAATALGMFAPMTSQMILADVPDDKVKTKEGEPPATIPRYVACARSIDELAKTSPRIRKTLDRMNGVGATGAVVAVHMPIVAMAAAELGLFSQLGKLFGKKKPAPEPQPTQNMFYDDFGNPVAA